MGPMAGLNRCGISRPHWHSIPDRPARSLSRYTDWATRPTLISLVAWNNQIIMCLAECKSSNIALDMMCDVRSSRLTFATCLTSKLEGSRSHSLVEFFIFFVWDVDDWIYGVRKVLVLTSATVHSLNLPLWDILVKIYANGQYPLITKPQFVISLPISPFPAPVTGELYITWSNK